MMTVFFLLEVRT